MNINSLLYNRYDDIMSIIGVLPIALSFIMTLIELIISLIKKINIKYNVKKFTVQLVAVLFSSAILILLIHKKSTLVSMPKVLGMTYGNAVQTLNENKIKFENVNISDPNNWVVIKQSIDPYEVVDANEMVTLELERRRSIDNDINLGDIDNNGRIDLNDATMIRRMFEGVDMISDFTIEQIIAADINHDNHITYIDAMITQGYCTYLMSTSDKDIMSLEEYYVNKFDESEYSDN